MTDQKTNKAIRAKHTAFKIGAYIRVSTEEQAENPEGSIKNQEERLKSAVKYKNTDSDFGEIVSVYIDRAKSGKDTNRPELQRLLSAIRRKEITFVIVTELSRLSRSIKDFSAIWEMMQEHECKFMSLRENFDSSTASGEMVLFSLANIAQYERRQVAERVNANIQARAERGLYNGGVVPLGYKLIADKKGYLDIDKEQAEIVRAAFDVFLKQGSLAEAAKWLNQNGYRYKQQMQGGGIKPRLGYFTIQNLHNILRNKAYVGVRVYKVKGEARETKAVWGPIIDLHTFQKAGELLSRNFRRYKPHSEKRYPFLLSGIIKCATCNERLSGKSAWGNGGKIPYYEHAWATKKQACIVKKVFACTPHRILAKKAEPLVWDKVIEILANPKIAAAIIEKAKVMHSKRTQGTEVKRIKAKIIGAKSQLEALAERLSELPKGISASHIYKQMEKLEKLKDEDEVRLREAEKNNGSVEMPVALNTYQVFLSGLKTMMGDVCSDPKTKSDIIRKLIHKIEVTNDSLKVHYYVGGDYIDGERAMARSLVLVPELGEQGNDVASQSEGSGKYNIFDFSGSSTLTNGVPTGN